ncbi:MAG: ribosomal RNA small subunit methyltransferase A [candidate division Zixibacteria bacterium]|nr:ribosomal RNA small subunit methyltransferase A [candidate division Zixibacteria bacterium]
MTGIKPKKRLGQHFLVSERIVNSIVELISATPEQAIVEIGPGQGALTWPLSKTGAKLIAVEFDRQLAAQLSSEFEKNSNVTILNQDFLKFEPESKNLDEFILCGNLPYNISSPVIDWTVKNRNKVTKAVFMLQKEVALRLTSTAGNKQWSPLAIFTQLHYETKLRFSVSPENFEPLPEVDSAVVTLDIKKEPEIKNAFKFEQVVRRSFKQRRKLLLNNLVPDIIPDSETAAKIFMELGFGPKVRAEEIESSKFLELTEKLVSLKIL